ncbi:MAG: 2Fe-2S iron-sulfur cluster-binding protein, partial [Spirochaetaceae bacterium]|nr:2Fe-2S iron-sulfur cluster-binding protein [Spirochaetaceae bacterium]
MSCPISFAINGRALLAEKWPGTPALDFIRRELGLTGTKEGCREGDCGACAVLVGELRAEGPRYRAMPSCLLALGDLAGRHLVTIEGLAEEAGAEGLTPVMAALLETNGSQCGFCSPGFVVSLTAFLAEGGPLDPAAALVAIEGNLCRCTGYGAILRAAKRLCEDFAGLPAEPVARIAALVDARVLPPSCLAFARGELE